MVRKVIGRGGCSGGLDGGWVTNSAIFAVLVGSFLLVTLAGLGFTDSWQQALLAKVLDMVLDGADRSLEAKLLDTLADLWLCQSMLRVAKDGVTDVADTSNQQVIALLKAQLGGGLGKCIIHWCFR